VAQGNQRCAPANSNKRGDNKLKAIPVKFQFDHVPKKCPKRSVLVLFNIQYSFRKTNSKWSILNFDGPDYQFSVASCIHSPFCCKKFVRSLFYSYIHNFSQRTH